MRDENWTSAILEAGRSHQASSLQESRSPVIRSLRPNQSSLLMTSTHSMRNNNDLPSRADVEESGVLELLPLEVRKSLRAEDEGFTKIFILMNQRNEESSREAIKDSQKRELYELCVSMQKEMTRSRDKAKADSLQRQLSSKGLSLFSDIEVKPVYINQTFCLTLRCSTRTSQPFDITLLYDADEGKIVTRFLGHRFLLDIPFGLRREMEHILDLIGWNKIGEHTQGFSPEEVTNQFFILVKSLSETYLIGHSILSDMSI